ncbi:sigma E protease regulator RseP [Pseudoalteromonas ruthenica]|uniref:Zinc metalloprotease n=1 Tax=Pseudoalteromonas ruthenica TaxID=151081 RepID=A0A0F4PMT5_9GAMM|nr:sigma E protease regulator RseP [Pseudoalteromonas ruthenica]KJY96290.1 zinc metallopeptidase RseP [Pseudoalteromonas ruthenica]KJY96343.1 zinc metallopeptidase RseP [Pseudoalteromonas ruthenica]TMO85532.1 sigma E protease regulator RseP [Pseudoalteromonas ruthenica]TMO92815.1 sigma E protease regulator RseP [Pseudoalteromonas ruthenica]TMO97751.1 sigma E protease regulator RseP [Pseudoalteromonas ruthenica]
MFEFVWHLGSFILALGILVTVHEYGHFWVARKAGVKVLRFSIGFGKPLVRWHDKYGTEYVLAMIPLGGYVKMLDERVDDVPQEQKHLSFNSKSVYWRIAIVSAGPLANFLFAIFALSLMYVIGVQSVKPIVGDVTEQSRAEAAGLQAGEQLLTIDGKQTQDWQEVTLALMQHLGDDEVNVKVQAESGSQAVRTLNLQGWKLQQRDESPLTSIGIKPYRPDATLTLAMVAPDSPAHSAGLKEGDVLVSVEGELIKSWQALVNRIERSAGQALNFYVMRGAQGLDVTITPANKPTEDGFSRGYLGVVPVVEPWPEEAISTRSYNVIDAAGLGVAKTWQMISLSFEMIANLVTGQVSIKNISGPVGIAVGAGTSVSYGFVAFLSFLALISVSLGVFNLLPLPVLDGGHLMYYVIELIRKKPVSEKTQEIGFRIGAMLLLALTAFALLNDIARL